MASRIAARLPSDLTLEQLQKLVVKLAESSLEAQSAFDKFISQHAPVPPELLQDVSQNKDVMENIMQTLTARDCAAQAVCKTWRETWIQTRVSRRILHFRSSYALETSTWKQMHSMLDLDGLLVCFSAFRVQVYDHDNKPLKVLQHFGLERRNFATHRMFANSDFLHIRADFGLWRYRIDDDLEFDSYAKDEDYLTPTIGNVDIMCASDTMLFVVLLSRMDTHWLAAIDLDDGSIIAANDAGIYKFALTSDFPAIDEGNPFEKDMIIDDRQLFACYGDAVVIFDVLYHDIRVKQYITLPLGLPQSICVFHERLYILEESSDAPISSYQTGVVDFSRIVVISMDDFTDDFNDFTILQTFDVPVGCRMSGRNNRLLVYEPNARYDIANCMINEIDGV